MARFVTFATGGRKSLKWEDSEAPARNPKSRRLFYKRGSLNSKEWEVKVYTNQTVEYNTTFSES